MITWEKDLNEQLSRAGRPRLADREASFLALDPKNGVIARYIRGDLTIHGVLQIIDQNRRAWAPPTQKPKETSEVQMLRRTKRDWSGPDRDRAVSEFIAATARRRSDVSDFRSKVLNSKTMRHEHVERWIQKTAISDGEPTKIATFALRDEFKIALGPAGLQMTSTIDPCRNPLQSITTYDLEYEGPADTYVKSCAVKFGGILNRLRVLSEELAGVYGWQAAQATLFVLTDLIPLIESVSARYESRFEPALDRIHLLIDPDLSPRQVEAAYRTTLARSPRRRRVPISEKRLRLAAFMRARPNAETYGEAMRAWNRRNPDRAYDQETNFGRDAKEALDVTLSRDAVELHFGGGTKGRKSK